MIRRSRALVLIGVTVAIAACAAGPNPFIGEATADASPAGFLLGIWHGFIVIVAFVVSLFSDSVSIYEVHNTGWPYNLGYIIGLSMALGSGGAAAGKKK